MSELRIEPVTAASLVDWQRVHNVIIPVDPLTEGEVRERITRHRLEVAYLGELAVGCTTVRPPADGAATVIVRVLAEHRQRGFGSELYARAIGQAGALGATEIETIVWAPNDAGLRFALARGFVEVSRYLPPGDDEAFVTLKLAGR